MDKILTFRYKDELYDFKVSDVTVADQDISEWKKTAGRYLRKFFKINPEVTLLKIPKVTKGVLANAANESKQVLRF